MKTLISDGGITTDTPVTAEQIQPASIDLRLGELAYRVRCSFLPGPNSRVHEKLESFTMHEINIAEGAVLEKGCVYIVRIQEGLKLKEDIAGMANPKSSTGRLDIFTRIISDYSSEFDRIPAGYSGPLYAEISPLTFSIRVKTGTKLNQLRLRRGPIPNASNNLKENSGQSSLLETELKKLSDVALTVDLIGDPDTKIIGYKARRHTNVIDVEKISHYKIEDFWEPLFNRGQQNLILDIDDFYILASKETVCVPPDQAAEMVPYDTFVGEFRVHYAGFFDPGFGFNLSGGNGSKAVLEIRSHDVPFVIEDGQRIGRLVFDGLTSHPTELYGEKIGSNYQKQGLKLSKHFR